MERKAVFLSCAWRGLEILLNFAMVAYLAALALYAATGPVDFRLTDHWPGYPEFRLVIGDARKPAAALLLILAVRGLSGYPRRRLAPADGAGKTGFAEAVNSEFGPPLVTLSLFIALYLLFVNVYRPWVPAVTGLARLAGHGDALEEAARMIPENAVLYSSPGAYFRLFRERPMSLLLADLESELTRPETGGAYFMIDTYLDHSRKDNETVRLMLDRRFRLVYFRDGVYLFGPGKKGALDEDTYIDQFLTFHAAGADHQVGRYWPDPEAHEEVALAAWPEKDTPGFLVYGRYMTIGRGRYQAVFRLKVDRGTQDTVAELDVASDHGKNIVARRRITGAEFTAENKWEELRFDFRIDEERVDSLQLRVIYLGGARLSFSTLRVLPERALFDD